MSNAFELARFRRISLGQQETRPPTAGSDLSAIERHFGLASREELLQLRKADWVAMGVTDELCRGVGYMVHANRELEELCLARNRFGNAGAISIAQALPASDSLRVLWLSGNLIADAGARAIGDALPRMGWLLTGCHLEELWLASNRIGDAGAASIAGALPQLPHLIKVDLRSNSIGEAGGMTLAAALPKLAASIKELYVQENHLGDAAATKFAEVLPRCRWLKELRLSGNRIGNEGAKALALALPNAPHLRGLRLASNRVGDAGGAALALALPAVPGLQRLELACNYALGDATLLMLAQSAPASQLLTLDLEAHGATKGSERILALSLLRAAVFGVEVEDDDEVVMMEAVEDKGRGGRTKKHRRKRPEPEALVLRHLYGVRLVTHVRAIGVLSDELRDEMDNGVLLDELRRRRGLLVSPDANPAAAHRAQDTHRVDPHFPAIEGGAPFTPARRPLVLPPRLTAEERRLLILGDVPTGDDATVVLTPSVAGSTQRVPSSVATTVPAVTPPPASRPAAVVPPPPSSVATTVVVTPPARSASPIVDGPSPTVIVTPSPQRAASSSSSSSLSNQEAFTTPILSTTGGATVILAGSNPSTPAAMAAARRGGTAPAADAEDARDLQYAIQSIFDRWDVDRSGQLSRQEFYNGIAREATSPELKDDPAVRVIAAAITRSGDRGISRALDT